MLQSDTALKKLFLILESWWKPSGILKFQCSFSGVSVAEEMERPRFSVVSAGIPQWN